MHLSRSLVLAVSLILPLVAHAETLSVFRNGSGTGTITSTPSGIACGTTCSASFATGSSVTLTAEPALGSAFKGWIGACPGTAPTCTVTVAEAKSVTAIFTTSMLYTTGSCSFPNTLCLDSYAVRVYARDSTSAKTSFGTVISRSDHFGYFSLPALTNDPTRPEIFVKVFRVDDEPWVFFGGLTNFEYVIEVDDLRGGSGVRVYNNPAGQSLGGTDTGGGQYSACDPSQLGSGVIRVFPSQCFDTDSSLCLLGRFRISLAAKNVPTGSSGAGVAVRATTEYGFFSLPALTNDPENVEVFVKVLDARAINGKFWVFIGGLTTFQYTVTVADTVNGITRSYTKPQGFTCGQFDTESF